MMGQKRIRRRSTKWGSLIREIRIEHGMTQVEFADFLGISHQTVVNWENFRTQSIRTYYKELIMEKFGVDLGVNNGK